MSKSLLIGMYRSPHDLLQELLHARTGATRQQYLEAFEHRTLFNEDQIRAMVTILRNSNRTVVLLGMIVQEAFNTVLGGDIPPLLIHPQQSGGCIWRQIPHPVVNRMWYDNPENRLLIELLMEDLYLDYVNKRNLCDADHQST